MSNQTTNQQATTPNEVTISWSGSFTQNYEDNMGPFFFRPFALDLVSRVNANNANNVLEIACGTGQVTEPLIAHLSETAHITATDISQDMMNVAQAKVKASNVTWDIVDMVSIPYQDNQFDMVISQFGLMFATDKVKALSEMYRVLKPGGTLLFNTWGNISENNTIWKILSDVMEANVPGLPVFSKLPFGPFALQDEKMVLEYLKQVGFNNSKAVSVKKEGKTDSPAVLVKGFLMGSPMERVMNEKDPNLLPKVRQIIEDEITKQLGGKPVISPLEAWIFEATK